MLASRPVISARISARPVASTVQTNAVVAPQASAAEATRRSLLSAGLLAAGAAIAGRADARDYKAALAEKEARKAKLRETAGGIKSSGKDQQIFKGSEYSVSEEARTPNIHSRQNEGARTQENI